MSIQERETLKMYSDRYWEMFNKIDGDFDDMAIRTFKDQLMDRIDEYKQVEEDQQ